MRRDTRFQKNAAIAEAYNPYLVDDDEEEEEITATEWNWGKKIVIVSNPWGKEVEKVMILILQKQTNFLVSYLRRERLNYLPILLYYLPIS